MSLPLSGDRMWGLTCAVGSVEIGSCVADSTGESAMGRSATPVGLLSALESGMIGSGTGVGAAGGAVIDGVAGV